MNSNLRHSLALGAAVAVILGAPAAIAASKIVNIHKSVSVSSHDRDGAHLNVAPATSAALDVVSPSPTPTPITTETPSPSASPSVLPTGSPTPSMSVPGTSMTSDVGDDDQSDDQATDESSDDEGSDD